MSTMILGLPPRFWEKAVIDEACHETPCLTWTANKTWDGYPLFWWNGRDGVAHRTAYEALVGPVPDGLEMDHLCRNRACVNADHLEPVTHLENVRRRGPYHFTPVTHCPKGHEYTPGNTQWTQKPDGSNRHRTCRACKREYDRKRNLARKASAR